MDLEGKVRKGRRRVVGIVGHGRRQAFGTIAIENDPVMTMQSAEGEVSQVYFQGWRVAVMVRKD